MQMLLHVVLHAVEGSAQRSPALEVLSQRAACKQGVESQCGH